jgi:phytoene dehydrogenase-like protein
MSVAELIDQLGAVTDASAEVKVRYGTDLMLDVQVVNIHTENGKTTVYLTNNEIQSKITDKVEQDG